MFRNKRTIDRPSGDLANFVQFCQGHIGKFENNTLQRSRSERHPDKIASNDAHAFGNGVGKRAQAVVGKVDGYLSELQYRLQEVVVAWPGVNGPFRVFWAIMCPVG